MHVVPLYSRILVKPIVEGEPHRAGIVIPDIARGKRPYCYAEVIQVGEGRFRYGHLEPMNVKVGDVVVYPRKAGMVIPIPGDIEEEYTLLDENECLGVVHDLPRASRIAGVDGRLLQMQPKSHAPVGIETWENSVETDAKLKEAGWDDGIQDENLMTERPQPGEH